ncbi:MAG: pyridoxamine 5'-phosphate oxidase family protein [Defluviitaleaceae bacterium]|nr:pyridoxamine 5'-phosphate oxidase family protein [Defluviitaleaceae bacterium]
MSEKTIKRAGETIASKTNYIGNGMDGFVVLNLIDENGCPSGSAITTSKSNGIEWISMLAAVDSNKVRRITKNNKAGLTFATPEYNISLTGTIEIITDPDTKKDHWQDNFTKNHGDIDNPNYCTLLFKTHRYNIYFADDNSFAEGTLTTLTTPPDIEPMLQFEGNCEEALEAYKKAFGAKMPVFMRYSDANPGDYPTIEENQKNWVYHAQLIIGDKRIMLCDNLFNDLPRGHSVYPVVCFKTTEEAKTAFDILSKDATIITQPTSKTYSPYVATLVDKFGIHWDLMVY